MRFFLIGYQLGHSMSPFLHGLFLDQIGKRGSYELKELAPEIFNDTATTEIYTILFVGSVRCV